MEKVKIFHDNVDVYLACPNSECNNAESLGVDEARHKLSAMPITEWEPDEEGKNEVSHHKCRLCGTEFKTEWDYDNIDIDEDE